jgi:hypothetical protein
VRVTARFRAPAGDGGVLAQPPLAEFGSQLDANADRLNTSAVRLAGLPLPEFRRLAVAEIIEAATRYLAEAETRVWAQDSDPVRESDRIRILSPPVWAQDSDPVRESDRIRILSPRPPASDRLIVAGHQPEFFHPGVWVKTFVLAGQARRHGRAALNLVVDNDTAKGTAVRVPVVADDPGQVAAEVLPFDAVSNDVPHEEHHVTDRRLLDTFPERLAARTATWGYEPLAMPTWPTLRTEVDGGATLGEAVSRARRRWERKWGATNFELPVSRLAGTRSFAGFVQTILAELPRFADSYNAALRAYRAANHLRGRNHPAPELARRDDWIEAPFWVWRADAPRRVKLFACRTDGGIVLRAGERELGRVPADGNAFPSAWARLVADGWKVRPRALTLTLFARLGFADGFIHGIGGGKYDEVTDDIIRRFFRLDPPGYAVVSATIRLPIRRFPATSDALHRAERRIRDLDWNPQRFPETPEKLADLVVEKTRLIEDEPVARPDRRTWFRELQRVTRDLRPAVTDRLAAATREVDRLRAELAANEILASREYAWLLFPEPVLRNCFARYK